MSELVRIPLEDSSWFLVGADSTGSEVTERRGPVPAVHGTAALAPGVVEAAQALETALEPGIGEDR